MAKKKLWKWTLYGIVGAAVLIAAVLLAMAVFGGGPGVTPDLHSGFAVRPGALPSGADEHTPRRESRVSSGEVVPGVLFTTELISLIEEELARGWGGWRPNNILIGGLIPLDNVENFQLGVLSVVRRVAIVMREKLARRGGGSDEFDANIDAAMTRFHMDETKFWFPDADNMFQQGARQLRGYIEHLENGTAEFQPRTDNIYALFYAFRDILGDCHQQLIKTRENDGSPVSYFRTDDYYYFSKGAAYAIFRLIAVVAEEFDHEIRAKGGHQVLAEMRQALERASRPGPLVVLNGDENDMRANHRCNLAAWIADARLKCITLLDIINR